MKKFKIELQSGSTKEIIEGTRKTLIDDFRKFMNKIDK